MVVAVIGVGSVSEKKMTEKLLLSKIFCMPSPVPARVEDLQKV